MLPPHQSGTDFPLLAKKYRRLLFYSRFVLLSQFKYYDEDGIAYSNLKGTKQEFGIPPGSLSPNLQWLKNQGYIEERSKEVYYITKEGTAAIEQLKKWIDEIIKI